MTIKFSVNINELIINKNIKDDYELNNVSSINNPKDNSLLFIKSDEENYFTKLKNIKESLIIIPKNSKYKKIIEKNNIIYQTTSPRKKFAEILSKILTIIEKNRQYKKIKNDIIIGENVEIDETASIEPFTFIDHDSQIGANCYIKSGARIGKNVIIKNNSIIRQNAVIGGNGFGIERDNTGKTTRLPHIGGVIIGENVEIGALTTVCSGTIDPTIIEDYVKVDDHVHIAHNCYIKRGTIITATAEISGSVTIGKNGWIGPSSSIMNGIELGDDVTIGLGAVVTKNISNKSTIAGNPGRNIEEFKKILKYEKDILNSS